LEYALSFYGLIPEAVMTITSVTTNKTAIIKNAEGVFTYQHIKQSAFRGFNEIKDNEGFLYFIAEPEKAVVDFLYLNLSKFDKNDFDIFENSYRFQNLTALSVKKLKMYASLFENKKLMTVINNLCAIIGRNND
jgi:hypothetical protein